MEYILAIGRCYSCGCVFSFNPIKVPSFKDEPICKICIKMINERRKELGNIEFAVSDDAYGE